MSIKKYGWAIQKSLFAQSNQDSTFSYTRENSKVFDINSNYFSFFNNKPPASWVSHVTGDFLTCCSCSYYSSIIQHEKKMLNEMLDAFAPSFISNYSQKLYFTRTRNNFAVNIKSKWCYIFNSKNHKLKFTWINLHRFNFKPVQHVHALDFYCSCLVCHHPQSYRLLTLLRRKINHLWKY